MPEPRNCIGCGSDAAPGTGIIVDGTGSAWVCMTCGGLGFVSDDPAFQEALVEIIHCHQVMKGDEPGLPPVPMVLWIKRADAYFDAVKAHYARFGRGVEQCFAARIVAGAMDESLKDFRRQTAEALEHQRRAPIAPGAEAAACRLGWIAAYAGNLDEAEMLLKGAAVLFRNSSLTNHDYGSYLVHFGRDRAAAMPWFALGALGLPASALFAYAAAENAAALGLGDDVSFYLETAATFDDQTRLTMEARAWVAQYDGRVASRQSH